MAFSSLCRRLTSTLLLRPNSNFNSSPVVTLPGPLSRYFASSAAKDGKNARKQHRGKMKGIASNPISFGKYGLQALEHGRITARQIEAGRRAMSRLAQRGGKIWVRLVADKPVSGKAVGIRMGKGKGAIQYWTSIVKPGRLIYEMDGVTEAVAKAAIGVAADKMPMRTRFFVSR